MFNRFSAIAISFVIASSNIGTIFSVASPALAQQVVTCESNNRERNVCSIDASGRVKLVKQLSNSSCEGNWGHNRNRIWVRNGCRAEFLVGERRNDRYERRDRDDRYDRRDRDDRYDRRDRDDRYDRRDRDDRYDRRGRDDRYDRRGRDSRYDRRGRDSRYDRRDK